MAGDVSPVAMFVTDTDIHASSGLGFETNTVLQIPPCSAAEDVGEVVRPD